MLLRTNEVGLQELVERFVTAQLAGDRAGVLAIVADARRRGIGVREVQIRVIAEAQREIGRLWEINRVSIAQEHLATALAHLALARLYEPVASAPRRPTVLLACVQGEHHDFGPRIAADVLDGAGYDVRFLGADVPTGSLADLAERTRPDVICLSATMLFHLPALRAAVAAIRAKLPDAPILVGGRAIEQAGAPPGTERAGVTADDLLAAIERTTREAA
jgi:methanogenic corrinoid protein MtbC1